MSQGRHEYYHAREIAERDAAAKAACPEARRVHEEMASEYARRAAEQRPAA